MSNQLSKHLPSEYFSFRCGDTVDGILYRAKVMGDETMLMWTNPATEQDARMTYKTSTVAGFLADGSWRVVNPAIPTVDGLGTAKGVSLGDRVVIVEPLACYYTYEFWAKVHALTRWVPGDLPVQGGVYTVIRIGMHYKDDGLNTRTILFGIEAEDGQQFIVHWTAITKDDK